MGHAGAEELFAAHRSFLWSLCYRLTGCAADADDLVQETFLRALERPPARTDLPWRPWLVRVAINLGRDLLRKRRRSYVGPWLPSPLAAAEEEPPSYEPPSPDGSPAARYDLVESASFAFLLALEALTPAQRAVLLLRDVFDYSVRETAQALAMSAANVKTTHLRARRALGGYDGSRRPLTRELQEKTRVALERFLACLVGGDVAGVEALLAEGVRALTDGGGEFVAALRPVRGRDKVARFFLGLTSRIGAGASVQPALVNGLPAVVIRLGSTQPKAAPRVVLACRLDDDGRIAELWSVSASRKLSALAGE